MVSCPSPRARQQTAANRPAPRAADEVALLIDRMATDRLEGADFVDHYTEALEKVIEAKREEKPLPQVPEPEIQPGKVVDLMAALQESVARAQASRGEDVEADVHEMPQKATPKKAAKKTPAAKKSTAGKTTAKKTTGRRPRSA